MLLLAEGRVGVQFVLPFPRSTAGGFEARRGSRATRAVPCASGRQPGGYAGGLGPARRDTGWGQPKNQGPARTANLWFVGVHELLSTRDRRPRGSLSFLLVSFSASPFLIGAQIGFSPA